MHIPTFFRTERLILRPPVQSDADDILRVYAQDSQVTRYLNWLPIKELADIRGGLAQRIARHRSGTELSWIITSAATGALMGMFAALPSEFFVEFGYVLGQPFWNHGFMTEALEVVTAWALAQPEIIRTWAACDIANVASARVLEKTGFSRNGILGRWALHPNISDEPR